MTKILNGDYYTRHQSCYVAFTKIRQIACKIVNAVTNQISDRAYVTRVIFLEIEFSFADHVITDIGRLSVSATADTVKHCYNGKSIQSPGRFYR